MNFTNTPHPIWFTLVGILSVAVTGAQGAGLELKTAAFITGTGVASNTTFALALHSPASVSSTTSDARFTLHGTFPGIQLVQTPGAPRLTVGVSTTGFRLQWPAAFAGFRLQITTSLTNPQWTDVPVPALRIGDLMTVEISNSHGAMPAPMSFYRLVRP